MAKKPRKLGRRKNPNLSLLREPIPMFLDIRISLLPAAEVIRKIDAWRAAYPQLANDPKMKGTKRALITSRRTPLQGTKRAPNGHQTRPTELLSTLARG
jgi:hypothetical protein